MSKYKVGDKVKITQSLFSMAKRQFVGTVQVIERAVSAKVFVLKDIDWVWREEELELVEEK